MSRIRVLPRSNNHSLRVLGVAAAFLMAVSWPAGAQESDPSADPFSFSFDEDELFGGEEMITVTETADAPDPLADIETTETLAIGGSFSGSLDSDWQWNDPWSNPPLAGLPGSLEPDSYDLSPALTASLFFDARPTDTTRFYGSAKSTWPFEETKSFLTEAEYKDDIDPFTLPAEPGVATKSAATNELNIQIFELFSDFNWDDKVFFRFGKQTITWGVGYFFSPADVLNIQAIDPEDPTEQREGPVSIRAHYPIPGSQNNLWAYAVFDDPDMKPEDTALAAKAEFVLGPWELGVGGWYRYDSPLRGMLTASGSIGQVSLFGEASLSLGSERKWVQDVSALQPGFASYREDDTSLFFKGSAGFMYANDDLKLGLTGQYLFDAEGYANGDRENLITDARANETAIKLALSMIPDIDDVNAAFSGFVKGLILNSGRHYAAASLGRTELFTEDLSLNVFVMANLSDFSGFARPGLTYQLFDGASLGLSTLFVFGPEDSEYIVLNDGPAVGITVSSTLGSGRF
ncbi:MAG: hypothetical protein AB7T74_14305 [Clostridia bacterium]